MATTDKQETCLAQPPTDDQADRVQRTTRLSIAAKMLAGYAVIALLALSVVAYVLSSLNEINRFNLGIVSVDIPVRETAETMINALIEQNGHEKRYVILRSKELRGLFWDRNRVFEARFDDLRQTAGHLIPTLDALAALHDKHRQGFLRIIDLVEHGRFSAAQQLSQTSMNGLVDRMLEILRRIPEQMKEQHDARMHLIRDTSRTALQTALILCLITTAVSIAAALFLTFSITSSIRRLRTATQVVAEGRFDVSLPVHKRDEIGELARDFAQMTVRLKKLEEMYLDASPLTRLPGGVAIEREIQGRLDRKEPMALCVMDLDNFKAYNDRYGYEHGNIVIKEAARIIEEASRNRGAAGDFVGHVGGDDYVLVTVPERIEAVCNEVISQFDRKAPEFYSPGDRAAGYIQGKTRQGVEMRFPLVTISIAVVTNLQRSFESPLEMAEVGAELKEYAKQFARSIFVVDKRRN